MKKLLFSLIISLLSMTTIAQTVEIDLGAKHNQVVTYLDNYDFTGKTQDAFMDDVFDYTAKLYEPTAFPNGKGGIWGEIWFCATGQGGGESKPLSYEGVVNSLQEKGKISAASNTFLNTLISETETLPDYNSFIAKVNTLESSYNTNNLPEEEKVIIQGAISVFKQSASMWNTYYSPNEVTPEPQGRFSLRCFFCVVKNDLKGALLGFIIGNCICKKLGVPKPVTCGIIGATVFGALYSWAAKVCPDVCTRCKKPSPNSYPSWICKLPFLYWP